MAEAKTTATKSTTKKTTATKKAEPKVDERDIKLAEQAAELEALKAQMQAVLQAQMTNAQVAAEPKKKKNVSIMSFAVGGLTLMGTRAIRIPKQFDTVSVSESEATAIVNNMPESARNGLFYIFPFYFPKTALRVEIDRHFVAAALLINGVAATIKHNNR